MNDKENKSYQQENLEELKETAPDDHVQQKKKQLKRRFPLYLIIVIVLLLGTFTYKIICSDESIAATFKKLPIFNQIEELTKLPGKKLLGEEHDRVNVLLLGMGGEGHDGAYLTDTIILASLKPSSQQIAILSIPRDLSVPTDGHGWQKINSINAFAEQKKDNSGGLATTETLSQLLNLPIPYYVRVDFKGFTNIVNDFGGLDLYVDKTLDDYQYPVLGREDSWPISSRTEHLHIDQGQQHMNGELALKYVRSRHAAGGEGSDFARSRRQQKILAAFKEKVFSWKTILSPKKIKSLLDNYQDHFATNLNLVEMIRFSEILKDFDFKNLDNIKNFVLDDSPGGYLYATASDTGAYILLPRSGDFSDVQQLAENIFSVESSKNASLTKPPATTNRTSLEILNGTKLEGFAGQTKNILENLGYKVVKVGNASQQDYEKTIIYDLTNGQKSEVLNILKEKLNADTSTNLPDWYLKNQPANPNQKIDLLILLGTGGYTADQYL